MHFIKSLIKTKLIVCLLICFNANSSELNILKKNCDDYNFSKLFRDDNEGYFTGNGCSVAGNKLDELVLAAGISQVKFDEIESYFKLVNQHFVNGDDGFTIVKKMLAYLDNLAGKNSVVDLFKLTTEVGGEDGKESTGVKIIESVSVSDNCKALQVQVVGSHSLFLGFLYDGQIQPPNNELNWNDYFYFYATGQESANKTLNEDDPFLVGFCSKHFDAKTAQMYRFY